MALSPERIKELNEKYGVKPAGNVQAGSRLREAWGASATPVANEGFEQEGLSKDIGGNLAREWRESGDMIKDAVTRGADKFASIPDIKPGGGMPLKDAAAITAKKTGALLETGLGVASGAVRAIFGPFTAVIEEGMKRSGATDAIGALADTQTVKDVVELAKQHPEEARNAADALNVLTAGLGQKIFGPALKTALGSTGKEVAGEIVDVAKAGAEKTGEVISSVTGKALEARRVASVEKAKSTIDETVGRIVQGKPDDIATAKRALGDVDTNGVKTYEELAERIDDQIEGISRKLDEYLKAADDQLGTVKMDSLTTKTKVGDQMVSQNFVSDALNQLEELYVSIKDLPGRAKIAEMKTKFASDGLTRVELNNLAKEYGREFSQKAFSKQTGDPLTSINAQAFENTRKGVKEAVRGTMKGDVPQTLDARLSDLIETSRLTGKMTDRVNALYQKVKKRGMLEKLARGAADVVNAATFNTVSGFISRLLPSNVGLKMMNSIDIEKELAKNLKKLEELSKLEDDDALLKGLEAVIRETGESAGK